MEAARAVDSRALPHNVVGTLHAIEASGRLQVRHPYHPDPVPALTTVALDAAVDRPGTAVLLAFADADPLAPIVIGLPCERVDDPRLGNRRSQSAGETLTARDLDLAALDSVSIRCGRSQLLMDKFGKIVIKGTNILTRASERNRLKGGSISLN